MANRCENGGELARFVKQVGHLRNGNAAAVHGQFQPIFGLPQPASLGAHAIMLFG
jgi:hypothetical protein